MTPEEMDAHAAAWEEVARNAMAEAHAWRERAGEVRKKRAAERDAIEEAQRKKDLATARRFLGKDAVESAG